MKLVIDRKTWLRGEGEDESFLLRPEDNKMCCLGFYCLAKGFTKDDILEIKSPGSFRNAEENVQRLNGLVQVHPEWCTLQHTEVCCKLMGVNDEPFDPTSESVFDETYREAQITEHFAKIGVEVEFVN